MQGFLVGEVGQVGCGHNGATRQGLPSRRPLPQAPGSASSSPSTGTRSSSASRRPRPLIG